MCKFISIFAHLTAVRNWCRVSTNAQTLWGALECEVWASIGALSYLPIASLRRYLMSASNLVHNSNYMALAKCRTTSDLSPLTPCFLSPVTRNWKSVWCICIMYKQWANREALAQKATHYNPPHIYLYHSYSKKTWCTRRSSKGEDDNWSQLVTTNISILLVNTNTYTRITCILFPNCLRAVAIFCCWPNFWTRLVCQLINYDPTISALVRCFSASVQREGLMYIRVWLASTQLLTF